ncbi:hypothetical protein GF373_15790, partial [bacterium]|nr:hypothetical protein [bacterium]
VRVDQFYPNARIAEKIIETPNPSADMHLNPVIHVRLQSGEQSTEGYVVYNSPKTFLVGQERATVYFGQRQRPLGFTIQLLDFRAPRYPGTNRPASFESDVMLIDESQQIERKQRIFMNNPLYHNNYAVYQSSYIEGRNGQPDTSIFTVARAPGTPVIYVGSVIMILGMIFLIYQKGGLKKQKQNPTSS